MDMNVPKQEPIKLPEPNHNLEPPIKRGGASLLIAVFVSALLLLAAGAIAGWVAYQNATNTSNLPQDHSATKDVKNVTWQAPSDLPKVYKKRDQNTAGSQITYYTDNTAACSITTTVTDADKIDGSAPREAVLNAAKAAGKLGITTRTDTDHAGYTIKDADGQNQYPFDAVQLAQDVHVSGVAFKSQVNVVAYKQFGTQLATIGAACKSSSWDGKQATLDEIVNKFTVKTER